MDIAVKRVLFDMDGTLIDSGPAVQRCWDQVLREEGKDFPFPAKWHGQPAKSVAALIAGEGNEAEIPRIVNRSQELELADVSDIVILPGTQTLLTGLNELNQEFGYPIWGIVTSCTRELFMARWAATGLPQPPVLVTVDDVANGKPAPDPYLLGAKILGAAPKDCLVFEDAPLGLTSAGAAGTKRAAVTVTNAAADVAPLTDYLVTDLSSVKVKKAESEGMELCVQLQELKPAD